MRFIGKVVLLGSLALLAACNPMAELDDADKAVTQFHAKFDAGDFDGIWKTAHDGFRGGQPKAQYDAFMKTVRARLGPVHSSERTGFNINTNNGVTTVSLAMGTKFQNGDGTEEFVFMRDGQGLKLYNYVVTSNALIANEPAPSEERGRVPIA